MTSQSQRYINSCNPGVLWAKSTYFQGLVFIPKMEKLLLWDLEWKGKAQTNI